MLRRLRHAVLRIANAPSRGATIVVAALAFGAGVAQAEDVLIIRSGDAPPYLQAVEAAERHLRDGGLSSRSALLGDIAPETLEEIDAPHVVIAVGTEAAVVLRDALPPSIILVYCLVADPTRAELVGRRLTHGVSTETPLQRQIELMAEAKPRTRVIGALYRSSDASTTRAIDALRGATPRGWRVEAVDIDGHGSIAEAVGAVFSRDIDFFWTSPERSIYDAATIRQVLLTSLRTRTPVFGFSEAFVRAGALVGVSVDPADQGRQAAGLILDKELVSAGSDQAPPAAEPTHLQANPRVALNRVVAEKLGLTLPASMIADAHQVYGE